MKLIVLATVPGSVAGLAFVGLKCCLKGTLCRFQKRYDDSNFSILFLSAGAGVAACTDLGPSQQGKAAVRWGARLTARQQRDLVGASRAAARLDAEGRNDALVHCSSEQAAEEAEGEGC